MLTPFNRTIYISVACIYISVPCIFLFHSISVRMLREELMLLQEQSSYVGEVIKPMDKKKVLVKVPIFLKF